MGVAMQMKKIYMCLYTKLNKKQTNKQKIAIILSTQRFKNCFHRIAEYLIESGYPRHAIVYIPTAGLGKIYEKHRPRRAT